MVEVHLYATLRRHVPTAPKGVLTMDVADGSTASALIAALNIDAGEVHMLMVNGVLAPDSQVLRDGDRVGLFPAIGGG